MNDDNIIKIVVGGFIAFIGFIVRGAWTDRKEEIKAVADRSTGLETRVSALEKKSEGVDVHIENLRELKGDMRKIRDLLNGLSGSNQ